MTSELVRCKLIVVTGEYHNFQVATGTSAVARLFWSPGGSKNMFAISLMGATVAYWLVCWPLAGCGQVITLVVPNLSPLTWREWVLANETPRATQQWTWFLSRRSWGGGGGEVGRSNSPYNFGWHTSSRRQSNRSMISGSAYCALVALIAVSNTPVKLCM